MAHTLNPVKDTIGFIVSRDAFLSRLPWRPIFPCHLFLDRFKDCDGGLDGKEHGASGSYHGVRGNVAQEVSLVSEKLNHCFSYFGCRSAGFLCSCDQLGYPLRDVTQALAMGRTRDWKSWWAPLARSILSGSQGALRLTRHWCRTLLGSADAFMYCQRITPSPAT